MGEHEQGPPERQAEQEQQQYPDFDKRDERADRAGLPREDEKQDPPDRAAP